MTKQEAITLAESCGAVVTNHISYAAGEDMILFFSKDDLLKFANSVTGWKTIDSAPKDGTRVLAWAKEWTAPVTCQYYSTGWGVLHDMILARQPTHWMPIPYDGPEENLND